MAKAKGDKPVRMLKCEGTGAEFPYSGRGRPPRFCPAEAKRREADRKAKSKAAKPAKSGKGRKNSAEVRASA